MRKPHKGLDSRRLTSLSLAPLAPDYLAMECLRHRHEDPEVRKKYIYGSLNRYIIYIPELNFSRLFHTLLFTGPLQTSHLQQERSVKLSDPAHTGSVTSSKTVTQASSQQVPGGQQLSALWTGSLGVFSPWISLCCRALELSPVFPPGPSSCLADVCVIYCSPAAGLSPASGFSACDSGGMRNWTSSVLMATLSG